MEDVPLTSDKPPAAPSEKSEASSASESETESEDEETESKIQETETIEVNPSQMRTFLLKI